MEAVLKQIRDFADAAHGEQMRKYSPDRYIVHPHRVMEICRSYDNRLEVLAAALLHDVLEDTAIDKSEMLLFLQSVLPRETAARTLELVDQLTDVYVKNAYPKLNRRERKQLELQRIATTDSVSQTIKYADIIDNSSEIAAHDKNFAPRFLKECRAILKVAHKGNAALRNRALEKIESELGKLG